MRLACRICTRSAAIPQQDRHLRAPSPTAVIADTALGRSAACRGAASFATASVPTAVMPGAAGP